MSAMFSTVTPSSNTGHIVEFKAGRCKLESGSGITKRNVVAEPEKGLVFIKQSNDQLMHFCWKNRETGALVDDLIIFPGDTEFKEVQGCPNGQVFMLKFKTSDERRLFWVQESCLEGDVVQKVNDALNKPPPQRPTPGRERNLTGAGLSNIGTNENGFQDLGALGGLDQNQLMQLLQFMNPGGSETPSLGNLLPMPGTRSSPQSVPTTQAEADNSPPNEIMTETSEENEEPGVSDETSPKEPEPKRGKPDDEMELD